MKIAVLQLKFFDFDRVKEYIKLCKDDNVEIVVLSDYSAMPFYKDIDIKLISKEYKKTLDFFTKLSSKYEINIILPYIKIVGKKIYKSTYIYRVNKEVKIVDNSILIKYSHWNESEVFSNKLNKNIITFSINGFKCTIITGIEFHYDYLSSQILSKKVDLVISPTSSTFGSNRRWRDLYKSRAFLNSTYIIRANRLGELNGWEFYGESMVITPYGNVKDIAAGNEELLIEEIDKKEVSKAKKDFKFYIQHMELVGK